METRVRNTPSVLDTLDRPILMAAEQVSGMGKPAGTDDSDMFDDTAGYDDDTGIKLASGLSLDERQQAVSLYRLFNELWGVCAVFGDPGTGKDLFGNYLAWKIKRFFPWKRVVRDERPRKLFGQYAALFSEQVIVNDLKKMNAIAKGEVDGIDAPTSNATKYEQRLERAADDWVQGAGEVMLKHSLLYLTEYWRYCYNREPMNPMNKTMGAIHKVKRHLDCLIVGTAQLASELDRKSCLPWVDWRVTCTRSRKRRTCFAYFVRKVKYDKRLDVLVPLAREFPIRFDAAKPRSEMGDGRIVLRKPNYVPETEEERVVLDVLKSGIDVYEGMVQYIEDYGDMSETEVLETLKTLFLNRRKRVVWYPCYFELYNSKSAPQLKTALKGVED